MNGSLSAFARQPLVQFLVVGGTLFAAQSAIESPPSTSAPARDPIVITAAQIETAAQEQENRSKRPLTAGERDAIAETLVREEVYFREAKALGLDRGDAIIRRRLVQKMRFLTEDGSGEPTDTELRAFIARAPERYLRPHRVTFEHVFFSRARRGSHRADALETLATLEDTSRAHGGDPFPHGTSIRAASETSVRRMFGRAFTDRLFELREGVWSDPIPSALGTHLVFVHAVERKGARPLSEVRQAATRDWRRAQAAARRGSKYAELRRRYAVEVEGTVADE